MLTLEEPALDIELVELTDQESEEPCGALRRGRCELRAVWVCTCRACGVPRFLCDPHYQTTRAKIALEDWHAHCIGCDSRGKDLEEVFIVVRLRGA